MAIVQPPFNAIACADPGQGSPGFTGMPGAVSYPNACGGGNPVPCDSFPDFLYITYEYATVGAAEIHSRTYFNYRSQQVKIGVDGSYIGQAFSPAPEEVVGSSSLGLSNLLNSSVEALWPNWIIGYDQDSTNGPQETLLFRTKYAMSRLTDGLYPMEMWFRWVASPAHPEIPLTIHIRGFVGGTPRIGVDGSGTPGDVNLYPEGGVKVYEKRLGPISVDSTVARAYARLVVDSKNKTITTPLL